MDSRERYTDQEELMRLAFEGMQAGVWTALPGIIQSFNADKITAIVQPAIQSKVQLSNGTVEDRDMSLLLDVPVWFPRGGTCTLTFPVTAGDECIVIFSCRTLDAWHQNGGVKNTQMDTRMHSMSDGIALVGLFSQATKISGVSTTKVELRSNDGSTHVSLDPSGQIVSVVAPGGLNITAPTVAITGKLTVSDDTTVTGTISGSTDVKTGTISLKNHKHGGVSAGGAQTGVPV